MPIFEAMQTAPFAGVCIQNFDELTTSIQLIILVYQFLINVPSNKYRTPPPQTHTNLVGISLLITYKKPLNAQQNVYAAAT